MKYFVSFSNLLHIKTQHFIFLIVFFANSQKESIFIFQIVGFEIIVKLDNFDIYISKI